MEVARKKRVIEREGRDGCMSCATEFALAAGSHPASHDP